MVCRRSLCFITLLIAISSFAAAQSVKDSRNPEVAASTTGDSSQNQITSQSLNESKSLGLLRSSYRDHHAPLVVTQIPSPNLETFQAKIQPVLKIACLQCHGPDANEGNFRVDALDPNLLSGNDIDRWLEVLAVLTNGEMPPSDVSTLSDDDRNTVIEWVSNEIQIASIVRRSEKGHSSFRRMTRYEYNYTLQDLLGLPLDFASDLPPESNSEDGFENSSEILHMSAVQFNVYRELSRNALRKVTIRGPRPTPIYWGVSMHTAAADLWAKQDAELESIKQQHKDDADAAQRELDQRIAKLQQRPNRPHYKNLNTGYTANTEWSYGEAKFAWRPTQTQPVIPTEFDCVAVIPPSQKLIVELGDQIPKEGVLRVRARASRTTIDESRIPSLQLEFGWQASNDSQAAVRVSKQDVAIHALPGEPQFYQWDIPLCDVQPRNSVRGISKMGDLPSPSEYLQFVNSSVSHGDIQIDFVEISASVYEEWPPASHKQIFFESANQADELVYATEILTRFMSKAWRRPATPIEVEQKLELFKKVRPQCDDNFNEAMCEVLATVLASPKFLYIVQSMPSEDNAANSDFQRLFAFELATRLSMFLWSSMPDKQLLDLALSGQLRDQDVLAAEVDRMLVDPRSRRFSKHFVRQWLGMQLLDFLSVDRKLYPNFDVALKEALQQEPIEFFDEALRRNLSVIDFLHADFTMANERLAEHYGIGDVYGNHFRRVQFEPDHKRGGLLTQAGLLAMNSDGKDSHPLKRGVWVLKNLLDDPPPPPPPAVPVIDLADPEIAKLTLKQRIENHRNQPACMSCHSKIDPWGIAFENYDAIGSWRTHIGQIPVDASSVLFNGQRLDGMDALKRFLLEQRQDQFTHAMVQKMATYALGRPLAFSDYASIEQITADLRNQGDGLATMVRLIVTSELFQSL